MLQRTPPRGPARKRRGKKKFVQKLLEQSAERSWQERLAWLSRPRVHLAIFEDAFVDEEFAKLCAEYGAVTIETEPAKRRRLEREKNIEKLRSDLGWSAER